MSVNILDVIYQCEFHVTGKVKRCKGWTLIEKWVKLIGSACSGNDIETGKLSCSNFEVFWKRDGKNKNAKNLGSQIK